MRKLTTASLGCDGVVVCVSEAGFPIYRGTALEFAPLGLSANPAPLSSGPQTRLSQTASLDVTESLLPCGVSPSPLRWCLRELSGYRLHLAHHLLNPRIPGCIFLFLLLGPWALGLRLMPLSQSLLLLYVPRDSN